MDSLEPMTGHQTNMAETKEARKVLVAMDGSDHSSYAFDFYLKNIFQRRDHVIILHCPECNYAIERSPTYLLGGWQEGAEMSVFLDEASKKVEVILNKVKDKLKVAKVKGKVKSVYGTPGHVIVKVAEEDHADMIVVGTRGQGTIRRTLLGSVSDYVLHHSQIPVVVCRQPVKDGSKLAH